MDKQCRVAVESAVSAAESVLPLPQGRHFFCYPLAVRNKSVQLKGSSLGLSLALAFLSLSKGEPLPRDLAASGALTPPDLVKKVTALEKKARLAEKRWMRVFLYPSSGSPPVKLTGMDLLPVNDLREAWMFARLYSPGRSQGLILLSEMLRDPDVFVNNMDLVEPEWLDWIGREGMAGEVISRVLDVPKRFSIFVDKIGWSLKNWKLEPARAMGSLVSPRAFAAAASSSALTALCFCTRNVTLANHRGDVSTAADWVREGELLLERALKADINACSDFLNNCFVARHNRYEFSPYLSVEMERILACMEKRRAAQCAGGCMADMPLGELYGTLCQNFGFVSGEPRMLPIGRAAPHAPRNGPDAPFRALDPGRDWPILFDRRPKTDPGIRRGPQPPSFPDSWKEKFQGSARVRMEKYGQVLSLQLQVKTEYLTQSEGTQRGNIFLKNSFSMP